MSRWCLKPKMCRRDVTWARREQGWRVGSGAVLGEARGDEGWLAG